MDDAIPGRAGHVQPVEELAGLVRPDAVVPVEVAVGRGRRLADVVEERRPAGLLRGGSRGRASTVRSV